MKHLLTAFLLLFSAATAVRVVVGEFIAPGVEDPRSDALRVPEKGRVLAAFYFILGKKRCSTCLTMEAYSRAVLEERLAAEAGAGRVVFRVVDTEKPGSGRFKKEFQLPSTSLVLADYREGRLLRFKNLNRIWRLSRDKKAFLDYVEREARAFLEETK